ncbi:Capsule assembly protein Wzi [Alteromonadaceae bacterium Bs31]|nr:Capsule assembly protein Wzi [Alteromonadaceae bacterium Bs31]
MSTLKEKLLTRTTLISLTASLLLTPSIQAQAEPWVQAGDERTRHHLQILADSGKVKIPLTTWPLMWSGVKKGLDVIRVEELSETELWSYRYLRHQLERSMRVAEASIRLHANANPAYAFTDFSNDFREGHEARAALALNGNTFSIKLQGSYLNEPLSGTSSRYDGSYAAITWSNWVLGVGAIERWWGPAWSGSTILGNNARPAPGLFMQRKDTSGGTFGSWDINLFISDPADDNFDEDAKFAGARLSYKPIRALEMSLSATEILGSVREEEVQEVALSDEAELPAITIATPDTETDIDADTSETPPQIIDIKQNNRMLSFDWRLSHAVKNIQLALYQQISRRSAAEEEVFGGEEAELIGIEMGNMIAGLNSRFALEYQDTRNGELSIFDHSFYKSGYRHYGRNMATTIDTASTSISLSADHYFASGHQFSWRLGTAELNDDNINLTPPAGHVYGPKSQSVDYASVTYKIPINNLVRTDLRLQHMSEAISFADEEISSGGQIVVNIEF